MSIQRSQSVGYVDTHKRKGLNSSKITLQCTGSVDCPHLILTTHQSLQTCPQLHTHAICEECFIKKYFQQLSDAYKQQIVDRYYQSIDIDVIANWTKEERLFHMQSCKKIIDIYYFQMIATHAKFAEKMNCLTHKCSLCSNEIPNSIFWQHFNSHF